MIAHGQVWFHRSLFTIIVVLLLAFGLHRLDELNKQHGGLNKAPPLENARFPVVLVCFFAIVVMLFATFEMTRGTLGLWIAFIPLLSGIILPPWIFLVVGIIFWVGVSIRATILLKRAKIKTSFLGPNLVDLYGFGYRSDLATAADAI